MFDRLKLALYRHKLKKFSDCYFHDVYVSKVENEFYHLDYLFQCANEIMVVKCYDFEGNIYGAENISEWTQAISYNGYKFENPLRELREICAVLGKKYPEKVITPYAVFSDKCDFPKSMPDGVIRRSELLPILKKSKDKNLNVDCAELTNFLQTGIRT